MGAKVVEGKLDYTWNHDRMAALKAVASASAKEAEKQDLSNEEFIQCLFLTAAMTAFAVPEPHRTPTETVMQRFAEAVDMAFKSVDPNASATATLVDEKTIDIGTIQAIKETVQ